MAGKSGTAQVVGIAAGEKYDSNAIHARNRDHALFIAFAPAEDPKIAVAVVIENGEHGGSVAGPAARKAMDAYLLGKPKQPDPLPAETAGPVVTVTAGAEANE